MSLLEKLVYIHNVDTNSYVDGTSPIAKSIIRGNVELTGFLLKVTDLTIPCIEGDDIPGILQLAIEHENVQIVKMILDIDIKINEYNIINSPIAIAIHSKSVDILRYILDKYPRLSNCVISIYPQSYTTSPLLLSIEENDEEMVEMLLEYGADVNGYGHTFLEYNYDFIVTRISPIELCIDNLNVNILKLLIKYGAKYKEYEEGEMMNICVQYIKRYHTNIENIFSFFNDKQVLVVDILNITKRFLTG